MAQKTRTGVRALDDTLVAITCPVRTAERFLTGKVGGVTGGDTVTILLAD